MNDELLKEFLITKYGEEFFTIKATDKAYELLHLKDKTKTLENGTKVDTIDESYYRTAFLTFLSNNYHIDGLVRVSNGNSHDESIETEVIIFNNGGIWQDDLNEYRNKEAKLYESKPMIIDNNNISKELIEIWSKTFDISHSGEGPRLIYCSDSDNKMLYTLKHIFLYGTPISNLSMPFKVEPPHLYLKRVKNK